MRFATSINQIFILLFFTIACSKVQVPLVNYSTQQQELKLQVVRELTAKPPMPENIQNAEIKTFQDAVLKMPVAGDTNVYGIKVTSELELAYQTYLGGDGDAALLALNRAVVNPEQIDLKWQISFLKAQVMLMMGRAADAEQELIQTAVLEKSYFGHDLNSTALAGEIKVWLNDFKGAQQAFAKVIKAIGTWELPISYSSFPTNRIDLYSFTTAKLRTYTGLTAIYILQEDYKKAQLWGTEAERLFNNVHFVTNHPLYGTGDTMHADSYYGRALNLTFLASAVLANEKNFLKSDKIFQTANAYFNSLEYVPGQVVIQALQARIYNRLGMHEKCYTAGQSAMKLAAEKGLVDFIWRIGILTGKTLLENGQIVEAEKAFRQAQQSLDMISGSLQTDRSKIRFGVGKEDITYHLAKMDIKQKKWSTLFEDLERGRARAFVELLADKSIAVDRFPKLMKRLKNLEKNIRRYKMMMMAPGAEDPMYKMKINTLSKQRQQLIKTIKSQDQDLASLLNIEVTSLKKTQQNLKEGELIAYAIPAKKEEPIQFLLVDQKKVKIQNTGITYLDLQKKLDQFAATYLDYENEEDRGIILTENKKEIGFTKKDANRSSFNHIFDFINNDKVKRLFVIPSGTLYFMPWGLLETDFPISVLPTGSWFEQKSKRRSYQNEIAIVGNPEFGNELPQLDGAENEAYEIGKIYHQKPLIGANATEENLRQKIGSGVNILHLATHGVYNYNDPLKSSIYLTKNNKAEALTAEHIFKHPLNANQVILSACETGLGKAIAGDDLLGLTRSFFLGGAKSVMGSLWTIEDEGTTVFMKAFHEYSKKEDNALAWLHAKNYTKEQGFPPSVYAAFVFYGIK